MLHWRWSYKRCKHSYITCVMILIHDLRSNITPSSVHYCGFTINYNKKMWFYAVNRHVRFFFPTLSGIHLFYIYFVIEITSIPQKMKEKIRSLSNPSLVQLKYFYICISRGGFALNHKICILTLPMGECRVIKRQGSSTNSTAKPFTNLDSTSC